MARYIDADEFMSVLNDAQIEFSDTYEGLGRAKFLLSLQPTADVVPRAEVERLITLNSQLEAEVFELKKSYANYEETTGLKQAKSEVAREIFEEIEESIAVHTFTSKSEDYADGMYDAIEWVDSKIAELKKKYTEGGE